MYKVLKAPTPLCRIGHLDHLLSSYREFSVLKYYAQSTVMGTTSFAEQNAFSITNTEEARLWVEREAPAIHPGFGTKSIEPDEDWKPVHDFEEAIKEYQSKQKEKKRKVWVNRSPKHPATWKTVLEVAEEAQRKYEEDGSKLRNRLFRSKGEYAAAVVVWLELMPQGDNCKTIQGGLTRLFTAAAKIAEFRIKIIESFEALTAMLQSAFEKRILYPDSEDLKQVAIKLYVTILQALDEMISWFTEKSYIKYGIYLLKGPIAYKRLDDLLHRAHRLQDAFNSKTATLEGMVHRKTESSVERMITQMPLVHRDTGLIKKELQSGRCEFQEFMSQDREWKKSQEAGLDGKKWLIEQCLEILNQAQWSSLRRSPSPPLDYSKEYINQEQFLQSLYVNVDIVSLDIENTLRQREAMDQSCQGQGAWLLQSQQFQNIISSRQSEILLVDGNADGFELERISPMSTLCAALLRSFEHRRSGTPIHLSFFCGLHTSSNDPLSGPTGMMRSLTAQLLRMYEFRFDFVDSHRYRDALESHDLHYLCAAFEKLVYQLPAHTPVFCVIDGISLFERLDLESDLGRIAATFKQLGLDPSLGCFFKPLITSPNQSRFFKQFFPQETQVNIPPRGNCDVGDVSMDDAVANARSRSSSLNGSSCGTSDDGEEGYTSDGGYGSDDNEEG
ncbi:uncharacterized protein BDZ99DRAFT_577641 [Mytilinidion resinicola]|uniref:Nephrocystin 3-like N-terminal domain-containing protein n=1 Tax=Mytilinidion resinicola TaxID=574789 RepID=A0A6A6XXZ7_9PEZI|nr:uncharacterized protein BDZ99DRAFT_577641 [Mytilinidion resinicola]KAF2801362.1 hypothetical protein BDZ99DRAFT_577641 [Mytilinidion resinicola]